MSILRDIERANDLDACRGAGRGVLLGLAMWVVLWLAVWACFRMGVVV